MTWTLSTPTDLVLCTALLTPPLLSPCYPITDQHSSSFANRAKMLPLPKALPTVSNTVYTPFPLYRSPFYCTFFPPLLLCFASRVGSMRSSAGDGRTREPSFFNNSRGYYKWSLGEGRRGMNGGE